MTFDTTNLHDWFVNASGTDVRSFASSLSNSGWITGWSSIFALTTRQINGLLSVDNDSRTHFIATLGTLATAKDNSLTIDYSGFSIVNSGTGNFPANVVWQLHLDYAITYPPFAVCLASVWVTHTTSGSA